MMGVTEKGRDVNIDAFFTRLDRVSQTVGIGVIDCCRTEGSDEGDKGSCKTSKEKLPGTSHIIFACPIDGKAREVKG